MSRSEVFKCDVCGKQKGEANHWFLANTPVSPQPVIRICGWNIDAAYMPEFVHLCGEECVQKKVSEFLSRRAA